MGPHKLPLEHFRQPLRSALPDRFQSVRDAALTFDRRDPSVLDATWNDAFEHLEVGRYIQSETMHRYAPRDLHADRTDLVLADPDPGVLRIAMSVDVQFVQRLDQDLFELPKVCDDVVALA